MELIDTVNQQYRIIGSWTTKSWCQSVLTSAVYWETTVRVKRRRETFHALPLSRQICTVPKKIAFVKLTARNDEGQPDGPEDQLLPVVEPG